VRSDDRRRLASRLLNIGLIVIAAVAVVLAVMAIQRG